MLYRLTTSSLKFSRAVTRISTRLKATVQVFISWSTKLNLATARAANYPLACRDCGFESRRGYGSKYSWFQTFAVFWLLYAFFWVIPRCLNFLRRRFGTLCLFHLHSRVGTYPPMKMEQSVPKRQHIKFRRRGITQKKAYNFQVLLISFPKCPGFSTIQSCAPNATAIFYEYRHTDKI